MASGRPTLQNGRGVIASTYDELQALQHLRAARDACNVPAASAVRTARTLLQCAEIGLLNLADLLTRAADDVQLGELGAAMVKMSWVHGFHRVLLRAGLAVERVAPLGVDRPTVVHIDDSPAFRSFLGALAAFDASVVAAALPIEQALADDSLDATLFRFLHLARLATHDATIWTAAFTSVPAAAGAPPYEEYVGSAHLRGAVEEMRLVGDTFFTQFRGLHQIPEIAADEVNERLEEAIRALRRDEPGRAGDHLSVANELLEVMVACVPPMADNLATADYHDIRENLGLTSGAHSIALRYHLFRDLYEQLCDALLSASAPSWLLREVLTVRQLIDQWRMLHMHLPRNNVGGLATKSLAGSKDAVDTVRQMREHAAGADPLRSIGPHGGADAPPRPSALQAYLRSPASLDSVLLAATGRITQERFPDVQRRTGLYAGESPFVAPPPRKVE